MNKLFVHLQCELPTLQSFFWSMLAGIVGTLILTGFFSGIMSLELLTMLYSMIVGFNAAIAGFMLIERTSGQIKRKKTMAAVIGTMVAMLSLLSINTLSFQMGGFLLVSGPLAITATLIGGIAGWAGGTIAVKHKELTEKTFRDRTVAP